MQFSIRRAKADNDDDLATIISLIDGAAQWLRLKDTDQWERPWPDEQGRRERIREGLKTGVTWIVWDGDVAAATVSITDRPNPRLWRRRERREPAVYLHRLAINRKYGGMRLGADLVDWAAEQGRRRYGGHLLRIDVWKDNKGLHEYYQRLGFRAPDGGSQPEIRVKNKKKWPSGAVFERTIAVPPAGGTRMPGNTFRPADADSYVPLDTRLDDAGATEPGSEPVAAARRRGWTTWTVPAALLLPILAALSEVKRSG